MKPVPIPMKQWLAANERTRVLPGDQWYLNFSASILSLVKQSPLFKEDDYAQKESCGPYCRRCLIRKSIVGTVRVLVCR